MKKTVSLLILLFATGLFAQEVKPDGVIYPAAEEVTSQTSEVLNPHEDRPAPVAGALTGIFYIIFLAAVGTTIWYFWKGRNLGTSGACCHKKGSLKGLEIGQMRSLGSRQFLVVARYRNKEMVIGVGPGFMNKIESFDVESIDAQKEEDSCKKQPSA